MTGLYQKAWNSLLKRLQYLTLFPKKETIKGTGQGIQWMICWRIFHTLSCHSSHKSVPHKRTYFTGLSLSPRRHPDLVPPEKLKVSKSFSNPKTPFLPVYY